MSPLEGKRAVLSDYERRVDRLVRALALEAIRRLVLKTPVDEGRARANWNLARTRPDTSADREGTGGSESAATRVAFTEARRVVAEIEAGDVIYATNALPYVPELDKGSSQQAPQGMTSVTLKELEPLVEKIVAKIRAGGDGL